MSVALASAYPDTGCKVHPKCLTCPLETCIYDREGAPSTSHIQDIIAEQRRQRAIELRAQGLSFDAILIELHVSKRTLTRYMRAV